MVHIDLALCTQNFVFDGNQWLVMGVNIDIIGALFTFCLRIFMWNSQCEEDT